MINLMQSHPSHVPTAGDYSHMEGGSMIAWWRGVDDDDGVDSFFGGQGSLHIIPPGEFRGGGGSVSWMGKNLCFRVFRVG